MSSVCRLVNPNVTRLGQSIFKIADTRKLTINIFSQNVYNPTSSYLGGRCTPEWNSCRYSYTFLSRVTADQLWKGVTSVSSAGKRKGRGKRVGRKMAQDLNRGQVIGFGKTNMVWPGLNSPVIRGKEVITQQELPPDETREKRIIEMRDQMSVRRRHYVSPLDRGWCGNKLPGRSLGPPDPIGEETFEGFDSRILQFKPVMHMSAQRGRVRVMSAFACVGNKKGLAGFALSKSMNGNTAANNAKNRAAQVLRFVERDKEHTVLHDFHTSFGAVNIFVYKKPEGFGLVCHRALRAICQMVGIKDMYAKVEGPTDNIQNITKAFFIGLMRQKLPQQIAEEKGLHLVEFRKERANFPELVASPTKCRTAEEIDIHEIMDFKLYMNGGRVPEFRKIYEPFYINFPSYIKEMKDRERFRNQHKVKIYLRATYGDMKSFLTVREEANHPKEAKDPREDYGCVFIPGRIRRKPKF